MTNALYRDAFRFGGNRCFREASDVALSLSGWASRIFRAVLMATFLTNGQQLFSLDVENTTQIIEKLKERSDKASAELAISIESTRKRIANARNIDPNLQRKMLDTIDAELTRFRSENILPDDDCVLGLTISYLRKNGKLFSEVETTRTLVIQAVNREQNAIERGRLKGLEAKVDRILLGTSKLQQATKWNGRRINSDGNSMIWNLDLRSVNGTMFSGTLKQRYDNGLADTMYISGERKGYCIQFKVTGMAEGKSKKIAFSGFVVGERMLGDVAVVTHAGKQLREIAKLQWSGK